MIQYVAHTSSLKIQMDGGCEDLVLVNESLVMPRVRKKKETLTVDLWCVPGPAAYLQEMDKIWHLLHFQLIYVDLAVRAAADAVISSSIGDQGICWRFMLLEPAG